MSLSNQPPGPNAREAFLLGALWGLVVVIIVALGALALTVL